MKQVLLIVGLVLGGALALALLMYWKNGKQPYQQMAAVQASLPDPGPKGMERGHCNCAHDGVTPQPGLAFGSPAAGPPDWSFFLPWPYSRHWTGSDTLPAKPFWVQRPIRGNAYGPFRQDLAVK